MNLFKLVSFVLNPQKAIDYANKNSSDRYKIGYLNEFFSTYLGYGKSNEKIVEINQKIDKGIETDRNFGVSGGTIRGKVLNVTSSKTDIPKNCIGIFPTSGPKHTTQFQKCSGLIFLNGAMTSHGAIIAREFGIPAIVAPNLKVANSENIYINGSTGEVKII